ncbi:hypothetical protein [Amphibacillus indicireducens]|uniref:Uncharacterized protein n=1 Tax=Amphibacillus indicireducens TaxID=1076330 RepID=A0ABP7VJB3_9BACI
MWLIVEKTIQYNQYLRIIYMNSEGLITKAQDQLEEITFITK